MFDVIATDGVFVFNLTITLLPISLDKHYCIIRKVSCVIASIPTYADPEGRGQGVRIPQEYHAIISPPAKRRFAGGPMVAHLEYWYCTGSSEPPLLAYAINTKISCMLGSRSFQRGSYFDYCFFS